MTPPVKLYLFLSKKKFLNIKHYKSITAIIDEVIKTINY